ncbi:MAG: MGMT family protein [Patescibacteria group bacterium]
MGENTIFSCNVYKKAKKIPRGKITTYKEIARAIGGPKTARAVGNAMHRNPYAPIVPCHRVVKSNGCIGGFASGVKKKIKMLADEGITVKGGRVVDFEKVLYKFR